MLGAVRRYHVTPPSLSSSSPAAFLIAAALFALSGCSSTTNLSSGAASGLRGAEEADGSLYLQAENGESVHVHPSDTVTLTRTDGQVVEAEGSQLCRTEAGVVVRPANTTRGDCAMGTPFARWSDIASIRVKQFNGAATVGVTTIAAGVVVVGVVLVAGAFSNKSKGSSEKEPSGSRQTATPAANGRTPATPGVNGAPPSAPPATPMPRPAPHNDTRGPVVAGGGDHHHHDHHGGGTTVVFLGGFGSSSSGSYASTESDAPAPSPEMPAPMPAASTGELSAKDATPLFSTRSERRAIVRPLVRGELTGCVTQPTCIAGGARVGAIFANLVDVTGGIRVENAADTTYWGVLGLGLHGAFPGAPAAALYLGTQLGFAGDNQFLVAPSAGVRLRPVGNLWLGLLPLGLTYYTKPGRAAYTPSLELGYDF